MNLKKISKELFIAEKIATDLEVLFLSYLPNENGGTLRYSINNSKYEASGVSPFIYDKLSKLLKYRPGTVINRLKNFEIKKVS